MRQIVLQQPGWEWVWQATSCADAQERPPVECDLVMLDLGLPDGSGLNLIAGLRQSGAQVLVFSGLGDETNVMMAIERGASGYLLKESAPIEIIDAIENVLAGGAPLTPSVAAHLLRRLRQPAAMPTTVTASVTAAASFDMLTARERDVLLALARGYSYDETADALSISRHTVGHHVKHIYSKLAVNSKSEAVFEAMQAGWLGKHENDDRPFGIVCDLIAATARTLAGTRRSRLCSCGRSADADRAVCARHRTLLAIFATAFFIEVQRDGGRTLHTLAAVPICAATPEQRHGALGHGRHLDVGNLRRA